MGFESFAKKSTPNFENFDREKATAAETETYIKYLREQLQLRKIDSPDEARELEELIEEMTDLLAQKSLTE